MVQIRTKEDQLKNKENKKLRKKNITIFNEYLINCNELFVNNFLYYFIFKHLIHLIQLNQKKI